MNAVAQLPQPIEKALDSEALLAAFEACPQALAVTEYDRILLANPAFAQQLGFDRSAEVRALPLSNMLPGISPDEGLETKFLAANGNLSQIRATALPVTGRELWLITAGQAVPVEPSSPALGTMEAVGRLVSGVAHDFNNLLTGILLYCDLLRRGVEGDARLVHYIDEMRIAGEQAATLIQQLMAVSRRQATEAVPLSWNDAVKNLQGLLRRLIGENIRLVCDLEPHGSFRLESSPGFGTRVTVSLPAVAGQEPIQKGNSL